MAYEQSARRIAPMVILVVIGALFAGIAVVASPSAQAATVTKDGIVYRTHKVKKPRWVAGGPNYRYQATLEKVKSTKKKHYVIPWSIKHKKHRYVVTEIVGDPFKKCKKAKSISVWAPLAYIEDMTFWRPDRRQVQLTIRNCGCYDYVMGGSTAIIL
jgi:hypothetical protein